MRYFAKPTGLERLSLEARIVYTGFCLFMLLGYATSAWLYSDDGLGANASAARRYYLGDESPAAAKEEKPGGPELELPDAAASPVEAMRFAKPPRQVMETFHFHLLTVPVCLLIVAHLFMMCGLSTRAKAWIIALSTVATLFHIVLPPLIRFASSALAVLMFPTAIAMALGWIAMTVLPVYEMWRFALSRARIDTDPKRE